jgi:hypothetical protein
MNLQALQHLLHAAAALADDRSILVLGSASLLASFPDLGAPAAPLAATYDADLLVDPFDELTSIMLDEALGEDRAYYRRHGYHADILRDSITTTLPAGWRKRLVPVPGTAARALDPHDLAAVKLLVARPKDLKLLRELHALALIDPAIVHSRINLLELPVEERPRLDAMFISTFAS